ncbi:Glycerate kinase [Methanosalsum zhilinae DSM 4017]|uniref:Glycerate kinase n=1 Tax=Methanosalsum zhilinae (strain DSM 4017 / NBRC 107636 / OCM 62 / WeN5) TaxID=679901 RepID=F7XMG6_METZD|nr:glycerate kinase [Methanosalsum zhilinae]AEH59889.1 Glycerate kinase [Methanosalsum zhilinae DSM 4017]
MDSDSEALKSDATQIITEAIKSVEPGRSVTRAIERTGEILSIEGKRYDLDSFNNIYVIAFGKAAVSMAEAIEKILGDRISEGIAITKYGYGSNLNFIPVFEAGHPVPDQNGLSAARKVRSMLDKVGEKDLVIYLISGGGSALLTLPHERISLEDMMITTETILRAGATIGELNAIRKHLSAIKGGGLARMSYPAQSISLILSDVVGDTLDVIASGPTAPDTSTFSQCKEIIERYNIQLPLAVQKFIEEGADGLIRETPKPEDAIFKRCHNYIIANNRLAISRAVDVAVDLGYNSIVLTSTITGEAREVARVFAAIAREEQHSRPVTLPACIIAGGETTVTVSGNGKGGRCQEFALSFSMECAGMNNVMMLCAGTDGTDGPTDAAGAFADGQTIGKGEKLGLNAGKYLAENNSYHYFKQTGNLLITGPTGTNVMDIYLLLIK